MKTEALTMGSRQALVGLPLPGGGGGGRGRAAPHRAGGHGASLGPCRNCGRHLSEEMDQCV